MRMKNRRSRPFASVILLLLTAFGALPRTTDAAGSGEKLTVERLESSPSLNGPSLAAVRFSPDGKFVSYLKGKSEDFRVQDLWVYDIAKGTHRLLVDSRALLGGASEQLSEVEKARRERQRIAASGIVEYQWAPDASALLFPLNGDLYLYELGDGKLRRLTETEAFETDPKFSPDGRYVAFVRERNLFVIDLADGRETAVTTDGGGPIMNGMAEFVADEEMDRHTGYWWSPDSRRIAYARVDESPVPLVQRFEVAADGSVTTVPQRYPFAGGPNVRIQLFVHDLEAGTRREIPLGDDPDIYLARVDWLPGGRALGFQLESRDQKRLDLRRVDVTRPDAVPETVLVETDPFWINLHDDLVFLKKGRRILWSSERSGFRHLYLFDARGRLLRRLTDGAWVTDGVRGVDEAAGRVFFEGYRDTVLERHLYVVPLKGGAIRRLTPDAGTHRTVLSPDRKHFLDFWSSVDQPPRVDLRRSRDGRLVASLVENRLDESHPYHPYLAVAATRRFGTITAADGKTTLHYELRLPPGFDPGRRYPAIVSVYGGPGAQRVLNAWSIGFDEILARRGFVVMKLDNRGSTHRGKAFESVLYRRMGDAEVADQLAGVAFLKAQPWIDPARIGVWGWSYGGYMTLELLAKAPETFAAGMAVAPVTDWRLYDTHYTERYLGRPGETDVYETSSVFAAIDGFRPDRLLLVHGMADDNVFFDHSVRLMKALQDRSVPFALMTYPGKRHGIRGEATRVHLWRTALGFFEARLGDGGR
ncbi:MAG: peptidase S9 [Rhodothalassiaceae bacterium]|nr:MAG: peptidase S9 [Rhodothalassiaceae bacterium]